MTTTEVDATRERAQALRDLIQDYPDLPRPYVTEIRGAATAETGVRMSFHAFQDVVSWGHKFGTVVYFRETTMFVRVSTAMLLDGVFILAQTQMHPVDAYRLLAQWEYDLTVNDDMLREFRERGLGVPAAHAYSMTRLAAAS